MQKVAQQQQQAHNKQNKTKSGNLKLKKIEIKIEIAHYVLQHGNRLYHGYITHTRVFFFFCNNPDRIKEESAK